MRKILLVAAMAIASSAAMAQSLHELSEKLRANSIAMAKNTAKLTAIHVKTDGEAATVEAAKQATARDLKDPDSAKFRNVRLIDFDEGSVVCGEINAKNSYGAYTGYKRFIASPMFATIERSDDPFASAGIDAACATVAQHAVPAANAPKPTRACDAATIERLQKSDFSTEEIIKICGRQ